MTSGWAGSIDRFRRVDEAAVLTAFDAHHRGLMVQHPAATQVLAWRRELETIRPALADAPDSWSVIFEYELPMEGGRRPDVIVLAGETVVVLEYKLGLRTGTLPARDQVNAYARDLSEYHSESRGRSVIPVLVLPDAAPSVLADVGDCFITSAEQLGPLLRQLDSGGSIDLEAWLTADYAPLPTLVDAARTIFAHKPLPHVHRAQSARIPEAVEYLHAVADDAKANRSRVLALVAGVPGAGKTLVGLRLVHEQITAEADSTFLSGNGPLVQVLQDALESRVFVRDLHAYIRTHGINGRTPNQHIVVFDEAQRAWDARYMKVKKDIERSEPELLIEAAERVPGWCTFVGLIGDGQEIHSGEEGGLEQWADALTNADEEWVVHCPTRLARVFNDHEVVVNDDLDLTISLRSRRAEDLHQWVQYLLDGSLELAARQVRRAKAGAFDMYLSRDLDEIRDYVWSRYEGDTLARYGLMASSHAKLLPKYGIANDYQSTKRLKVAPWYNAEPEDPLSGCQLDSPVTEFSCQGLELDFPVVAWGEDLRWEQGSWAYQPINRKYPLEDPFGIVTNVYRVLLTRGRDGFAVYVPPDPLLDATVDVLIEAGVEPLALAKTAVSRAGSG